MLHAPLPHSRDCVLGGGGKASLTRAPARCSSARATTERDHSQPSSRQHHDHDKGPTEASTDSPPSDRPQAWLRQRLSSVSGGGVLSDKLTVDVLSLALPTLGTLAVDPLASLVDTAYIGHWGSVELAATGVALSVCSSFTKLVNIPLLSVTTNLVAQAVGQAKALERRRSTVAEERHSHYSSNGTGHSGARRPGAGGNGAAEAQTKAQAKAEAEEEAAIRGARGNQPSVAEAASLALTTACGCGVLEGAVILALGGTALSLWGAPPGSPLRQAAMDFLQVKAITSPATALLLVSQGVFRGLGDTRQPLAATLLAELLNVALAPLLIFGAGWGVRGAAAAAGAAELAAGLWVLSKLAERHPLSPSFQGGASLARLTDFLRLTGLLSLRTLANLGVFATASSLAARSDPAHAAAYQVCLQLWLATSMLADSLAVAAQTLTATALAEGETFTAQKVVERTTQMGLGLGLVLALGLGAGREALPALFSEDGAVTAAAAAMLPWVLLSQPVNALAFTGDGVLYGVSAFGYAAKAMAACAVPAVGVMLLGLLSVPQGAPEGGSGAALPFVWGGLVTLMALRGASVYVPYCLKRAPFEALFAAEGRGQRTGSKGD